MSFDLSRRGFLAASLSSLASFGTAAPLGQSLRPVLRPSGLSKQAIPSARSIVEKANLGGQVSFAVADAVSGQGLESHKGAVIVPPASVTKAVTALYALEALGPEHRFETQVLATGGIVDGIVQGDLVLKGGCDPTLTSDDLASLAAQMKDAGIRSVKGRLLVDDSALPHVARIDPGQPDHVGYNPGVSGIALNFNRVHFEWRRGSKGYGVTMEARTKQRRPSVTMARMQIVERNMPVYAYSDAPKFENWSVSRRALGKEGARWLPVRKPALYAGDVLRNLAGDVGVSLPLPDVKTVPGGEVVARHQSGPLREILTDMLKYSTNLTAEMVGLAASHKRLGRRMEMRASAEAMSDWAGQRFGMTRAALVDHSGLGDDSRMTAFEMVRALAAARGAGYRDYLKKIGIRDDKGRPVYDHPIQVQAKTGTLNFVSALAGYMTAPDGRELVFAIFAADVETRARIPKSNREAPKGARGWNGRAKRMQQALIRRWGEAYRLDVGQ